jgi:hypothetical protein
MQFGFAKTDITPRVGVDLSGFGPFRNRVSVGVRDRLWARAMAVSDGERTVVVVNCDLIGVSLAITRRVRDVVTAACGVPADAILISCTHTHSGPAVRPLGGWGRHDPPYLELLPGRIAEACVRAVDSLAEGTIRHAYVPCEGVGLNREYDRDAPPLEDVLREDWRPAKPELTDTRCHVLTIERDGALVGFVSSFGCHPVVCCAANHYIHGDYCGVATNLLEREHPGSVGLFLQGAQGDVNSCVVHKGEQESLLALDVIASRYARAVRAGIANAEPLADDTLAFVRHDVTFRRNRLSRETLAEWLREAESAFAVPGASDEDQQVRMATVHARTLRALIQRVDAGDELEPATELQGIRIGPIALLGAPFEIFQAIKNRVVDQSRMPVPLVLGLCNDCCGYAPDWERGGGDGYAAKTVPMIVGELPFDDIATQLTTNLLALDAELAQSR